jgi:Domain of Unknown Function with PDB structure (DUF3857)
MKLLRYTFLIFFTTTAFSQKTEFATSLIADSLKQNANAVVRFNQTDINIESQRFMKIKTKRVVTIFNEKGLGAIEASESYNKKLTVNDIQATVYNGFGLELKRLKRKDFKDFSSYDGYTMFSDNRNLVLEYTPTEYPFTIIYESEISTSTTAFIPNWMPITDLFVSVEKSILNVYYPADLGFKKKEIHFEGFPIQKTDENSIHISYLASNIVAIKPEDLTPADGFLPKLMMAIENFNLEGVDGTAASWKDYGKWYADKILTGTDELSEETISKIQRLVGTETDPSKKAKIIYKFVQEKSRYVSIQVGIGGWKPMLAKDVDRLGYGDCKALSNYTRSLLKSVGVTAYNTLLYGDKYKRNFQEDFVSMQGNHMILCVPNNDKNIFLECTSQDDPFGYQAGFTDDRNVLIIKPDGGEIVKTTQYPDKSNTQISKGNFKIDENGNLTGAISIVSEGYQYRRKANLEKELPDEKDKHYKAYWDNINNLKINKIAFENDKEKISFTENIDLNAANYGKFVGNNLIFETNAYNHYGTNLKRIRNRKTPFEIQRGFVDEDQIEINLPTGFAIDFIPQKIEITNNFGAYTAEIIKKDASNLIYKRALFIKSGLYPKTEYETYRLFMEEINRNDNSKIILTKNQ